MKEYPHSCSSSCTTYPRRASPAPPRLLVDAVRLGVRSAPARNRTRARIRRRSEFLEDLLDAQPTLSRARLVARARGSRVRALASTERRRRYATLGSVVAVAYVSRVVTGTGPGPRPHARPGHTPRFPRVNTRPWRWTRREEIRGAF